MSKPSVKLIAIAAPLIKRGFRVTVLHPDSKVGVLYNWPKWQFHTASKLLIEDWLNKNPKYSHYNVGVVGRRGVGHHCLLDIDAPGVLERIESDMGCKMPMTYTVQSRPVSAKYKRHFYFLQTDYSFQAFAQFAENGSPWKSKEMNVRDLTKLARSGKNHLIHPTLYDLKGIGGGGLV